MNTEVLTFCDILSVTFGALALQVISMNGWNGRDKHKSLDLNWDGNGLLQFHPSQTLPCLMDDHNLLITFQKGQNTNGFCDRTAARMSNQ